MTQTTEISAVPPNNATALNNGSADALFAQVYTARRIQLHRLTTRKIAADKYLVGRAGVRGAIVTGSLGAAAIDMLRKGQPRLEVEAALSRATETDVEIRDLLLALLRAGFIREADSTPLDTSRIKWYKQVTSRFRARRVVPWVTDFVATRLPPRMAAGALARIRYHALAASREFSIHELRDRIASSGLAISASGCRQHQRELADQDALTRLIIQSDPVRLDRWLRKHVCFSGRQHLLDAIATGRGAIIATFHYGAFPLLPVSLAANGFPISMPHFGVHFGSTPHERVFEAHVLACGWAPVVVHRTASLSMIAQLSRTLRAGGVVCIAADYCRPALQHAHSAKKESDRQASISVTIAGRAMTVENLVGWLVTTTGATILPALSYRGAHGDYTVEIRPGLKLGESDPATSRERAAQATRSVVAALQSDVVDNPLKWAFLSSISQMQAVAS